MSFNLKQFSNLIISLLIINICTLNAQNRYELGLLLGGSCYQGDVLGNTVSEIAPNIHGSAALQAGYFFNRFFGIRTQVGYGKISGGDKYSEDIWRQARNLSFTSNLYNVGIRAEYNITGYDPMNDQNFTAYPFIGYNHVFFNPRAEYKGKWYDLQPLGTEGQGLNKYPDRKPYKLNAGAIMFGGGLRLAATPKLSFGIEFAAFRVFSDYIDDVAGYYVPYTDILQANGNQIAAALSNREGEKRGSDEIVLKSSSDVRGNLKVFDYYYQFGITMTYNFFDPFSEKARNSFRKKKSTSKCFKF